MTWDALEQAADPRALLEARQRSARFNRRYGAAIRALREGKGLRQSDVPGLDSRHVRRIERGGQRVTLNALRKLAQAHDLSVTQYMDALARSMTTGTDAGDGTSRRLARARRR
jgi:transcriptional regulator with XRE-family HTH domain